MRRLGTILACLAAIVVVLLLPPAWVPYGMLAGVTGLMFMARNGRVMGVSAFVLFIIILAKQIYMPWSAWFAEGALAISGTLGFLATRLKSPARWIMPSLTGDSQTGFLQPVLSTVSLGWMPQLSDDGIHPNACGNRTMAAEVRDAIRELNLPESAER